MLKSCYRTNDYQYEVEFLNQQDKVESLIVAYLISSMKKDDDAHKTHTQAEARNRVLVVSLQTGLVPLLRFLLSADGLEVVTAQEPRDVLEKLGSTGAKILLLDLHLPTANAMRLLETIRVSCPQVFVITMAESACRELAVDVVSRPESAQRRTVSSLTPNSSAACLMRYVVTAGP